MAAGRHHAASSFALLALFPASSAASVRRASAGSSWNMEALSRRIETAIATIGKIIDDCQDCRSIGAGRRVETHRVRVRQPR